MLKIVKKPQPLSSLATISLQLQNGKKKCLFPFLVMSINTEDRRNANNRTGTNSHTARVRRTLQMDWCADLGGGGGRGGGGVTGDRWGWQRPL